MAVRVTGATSSFGSQRYHHQEHYDAKSLGHLQQDNFISFVIKNKKKRINQNQDLTDEGTLCELVFKRVNLLKQEYKDVSEWYEAKTL